MQADRVYNWRQSFCNSKHGICAPKCPIVRGSAPNTPGLKGEKTYESKYK